MKIYAAGVGAAGASKELWNTGFIIEKDGLLFAIDVGCDALHSWAELPLGITAGNMHQKIHSFWISHFHADHIGRLELLALAGMFAPNPRKPIFYGVTEITDKIWDGSLRNGLQTVEGLEEATIDSFFERRPQDINGKFYWQRCEFLPVELVHVPSGRRIQHSYGLIVTDPDDGVKVFFTTDTQWAPEQIDHFIDKSDLVIHDCETMGYKGADGKWVPVMSRVHPHYERMRAHTAPRKAKMKLVHYNQTNPPYDAVADGFMGFMKKGEMIDTATLKKAAPLVAAK